MDKEFLPFEKLIGKRGRICTAKPPHLSLKQSSHLIKSFNDCINLQDVTWRPPALTNLIKSTRSKRRFSLLKRYFSPKRVNANPYHWGFRGALRLENPPLSRLLLNLCCHEPLKASTVELVTIHGFPIQMPSLKEQEILTEKDFGKLWYGIAPIFSIKLKTTRA